MDLLLLALPLAAALEVAGDAFIRLGLERVAWRWLALGAVTLFAYGLTVNAGRQIAFNRLMGLYIAVFFVVSQVLGIALFGERPSPSLLAGGALIVAGGVVIQLGAR